MRIHSRLTIGLLLLTPAAGWGGGKDPRIDYSRQIQPLLADRCLACHGPDANQRKANLRLDLREQAIRPRRGRAAIVPGRPDASALVARIFSEDQHTIMPPPQSNRKLNAAERELLKHWIAQGAEYQQHWAFIAPKRPPLPAITSTHWPRTPIDHFILAKLERAGLQPAAEAERATLIRRVTLDLTGVPPTLEEVDAFLADRSPGAFERVVDRLLSSPRYGERMVWEWLDAARYADTNGYQGDRTRTLWPWRDWAIAAFNANLPFDQFTIEQLAGDLLPNPPLSQRIATGFHRNHMLNGEGGRIAEESRIDYVVDRVDTTATVWLGLTLGCARCHDHKFDPFSQKEYYQLFAYYNNLPESGSVDRGGNAAPVLALPTPEQTARIVELKRKISELEQQARISSPPPSSSSPSAPSPLPLGDPKDAAQGPGVRAKQLDDLRKQLKSSEDSVLQTMVMEERPQPRESFVLVRGAYDRPGEKVSCGVPTLLSPLPADAPANRLALARWLVAPEHPLTARVAVNRAWQLFFGTGLVKTTEDFGVQGECPSHPELLDWLATEFVRTGWDVKRLHKLIVMSATYRQSSRFTPRLQQVDPENRLLARGPRYRLPAPMLRDQALAVSGLLVDKVGGPPVKPYQPEGVWEDATFGQIKFVQDHGEKLYRRSVYTYWRRIVGPTMFFDAAARQTCVVRTARTNTPLHALTMLNDVQFVEAARQFAERVMMINPSPPAPLPQGEKGTAPHSEGLRLEFAFRLATARTPTEPERLTLQTRLRTLRAQFARDPESAVRLLAVGESPRDAHLDPIEHAAWTVLCNLLLNLDEVVTKE